MSKSRFTEEQILKVLKEHESVKKIADICREHGISDATLYKWKQKNNDMGKSELQRLRELENDKPNQVWAMDITYIPMAKGFMYLRAIIDLYSKPRSSFPHERRKQYKNKHK